VTSEGTVRSRPVRDRRWLLLVAIPIVVGLVIRLVYYYGVHKGNCPAAWWVDPKAPIDFSGVCPGDSFVYHESANLLADGHGMTIPSDFIYSGGEIQRAYADHPPLFTWFLAGFSWLGMSSWVWHELLMIGVGLVNIALTGWLGRKLGGIWVGFLAAMFMAVYPYVWLTNVTVMSENIAMTANLAVALCCYKLLEDRRWRWAIALGVFCAAAALVRAEMIFLGPALIVPLVLVHMRDESFRKRLAHIAVAGLAMVAVLAPWVYRNMTVFNNPVYLSNGIGITLANTNCHDTYYESVGYWSFRCIPQLPWTRPEAELRGTDRDTLAMWVDQSGLDAPPDATTDQLVDILLAHDLVADQSDDEVYLRAVGMDYLTSHKGRLPVVVLARVGRMWNLFHPIQQLELENGEGRPEDGARFGLVMYYPLMLAAVGGAVVAWRRKIPLLPLLVPAAIVTFAAVTAFGQSRYRAPAEPMLLVLSAFGFVGLWEWWKTRGRASPEPADPSPTVEAARP